MKIVIIGGSGLIGKKVTALLTKAGHEAVPASPSTGINTLTGEGLSEAFKGAQVVVDVSNSPSFEAAYVLNFFTTSAKNITAAEKAAGVQHHVALSVVGADRMADGGYMRAKVEQEKIIQQAGIPYTIVRATQFFEFLAGIADASTQGDTVTLPQAHMQPLASDDVAAAVARVATAAPANDMLELAGPEKLPIADFVQKALAAKHDKRKVVAAADGLYFGASIGDNTLTPGGAKPLLGDTLFSNWLAAQNS